MCERISKSIINSLIKQLKKHPKLGKYKKLDMNSSKIFTFSNGSFSGNNYGSLQVGYIIIININIKQI